MARTVEGVVALVRPNVEVEAALYKRKIRTRATVVQRIGSLPPLCCHLSSFLSPPPYSSLQPPCILLSPPVSSTCPLAHAPSFPYSVLFFLLPPYITFIFLVSFLKIAVHLYNHSIFPPHPLPIPLSVARSTESNRGERKKTKKQKKAGA